MRFALALLVCLSASLVYAKPSKKAAPYVAIAAVKDKDGRQDLVKLTDQAMREKLTALGGVIAPAGETAKAAKAQLKKRRLKGYELHAELSAAPNGGLRLSILCFTYPGRSLLGEVSVKGAGAKPPVLVKALVDKVLADAADTFEWM
jgi:hypothetical protein